MKNIPTEQEISEMSEQQCRRALSLIEKTYALDAPITREIWTSVDIIANAILYLEDRITWHKQMLSIDAANAAKARLKQL